MSDLGFGFGIVIGVSLTIYLGALFILYIEKNNNKQREEWMAQHRVHNDTELQKQLKNDKKKLTPILEQGWGFTETTASRALGSKLSQKVADKTASIFESVSPKLARLIKEFPHTFETIRINKLKANNEKKVKNK